MAKSVGDALMAFGRQADDVDRERVDMEAAVQKLLGRANPSAHERELAAKAYEQFGTALERYVTATRDLAEAIRSAEG